MNSQSLLCTKDEQVEDTITTSASPGGVMLDFRLNFEEPQQKDKPPVVRVKEGSEVYRSTYDSVVLARKVAQDWTGKSFDKDIVIETVDCKGIHGKSGGMLFTLQFIRKLTGIPLNPEVSGTGIIKADGSIGSAEYVKEKANAAAKAGCKIFLHNSSSEEDSNYCDNNKEEGIRYIRVSKIDDAWALGSQCRCTVCELIRRKKEEQCNE